MNKLIGIGAESQILQINENTLKKIRLPKTYRHPILDLKLRKSRNKREFKVLNKLLELKINAPKPFEIIENKEEISFTMQYLKGNVLKHVLNQKLLEKAFQQIIKLHKNDITHGDLTTLNMIETENEIYLIDFGLSEFTKKIEDKAVDLNLFFTCIKNEHPTFYDRKDKLLQTYTKELEYGEKVIKRLEEIEHRGRNK